MEETRVEMRKMQINFAEQEAIWREKSSVLEVEIKNKDQRLEQLEDSLNRAEKVRFELTTKNAEMQEKIVNLQTQFSDIKTKKDEDANLHEQFEEKMKEKILSLERTIEISERTKNDRKDEFVESIKSLVSDQDMAEQIVKLEEKITELEEEKGNLQLKLVDFEDLANSGKIQKEITISRNILKILPISESNVSEDLKMSQVQVKQLDTELQNVKDHLDLILRENEDLTKAVTDRDSELYELASKLENLLSSNEDLSLSKVKIEMKSVELEEQKDRLEEERQELMSNIAESRKYTEETVKTLIEVQKAHAALNKKMEALETENAKYVNAQRIHDEGEFFLKSTFK